MWCSSLNNNFFYRYSQFKRNSIFFNKTLQAIDAIRRNKPGYFNRQILYRKLSIKDGWITPFYLLLQFAPLYMVHYILRHRDRRRPIASDNPSVMHSLCSRPFCLYELQIIERIDYVVSRFVELDLFENDKFGRPCFFYVRKAEILNRLLALGASADRSCAEFAVETDNAILLNACVPTNLDYLPKAVVTCKPNVIHYLLTNNDDGDVPPSLRREAYVALAMYHRFHPVLFQHYWTLADQIAVLPSDDFCDRFYSTHYGPDSPQRFGYRFKMILRTDALEHVEAYLDLMLRYPETFRAPVDYRFLEILPRFAVPLGYRYAERLVAAYPRFAFSRRLIFLFRWMDRLKNCAFAEALLSRAVAFRGERGYTFLHLAPNLQFLQQCLTAGADMDALDNFGNTPLVFYAKEARWDCSRLLVTRGAHRDVKRVNYELLKRILGDVVDVFPLRCLAARVISKHCSAKQKNLLPNSLKTFVKCH